MIAVIFEVWVEDKEKSIYLDLAAELRPLLDEIDGFISIERFESIHEKGKMLSLSFWRDEEAVARWRKLEAHRQTQARGRNEVFQDYRLRVASVIRDYGMTERQEVPIDSQAIHDKPQNQ